MGPHALRIEAEAASPPGRAASRREESLRNGGVAGATEDEGSGGRLLTAPLQARLCSGGSGSGCVRLLTCASCMRAALESRINRSNLVQMLHLPLSRGAPSVVKVISSYLSVLGGSGWVVRAALCAPQGSLDNPFRAAQGGVRGNDCPSVIPMVEKGPLSALSETHCYTRLPFALILKQFQLRCQLGCVLKVGAAISVTTCGQTKDWQTVRRALTVTRTRCFSKLTYYPFDSLLGRLSRRFGFLSILRLSFRLRVI